MSDDDLLDEFEGMVEVSELHEAAEGRDLGEYPVMSPIADRYGFDHEEYDSLLDSPSLDRESPSTPKSKVVLRKLAQFAQENDYDHIEGCIAFDESTEWIDHPEDESYSIRGFGFSDGTRYVFHQNGQPWYENLELIEVEGPMFVEFYMNLRNYIYVEPWQDGPFWAEGKHITQGYVDLTELDEQYD